MVRYISSTPSSSVAALQENPPTKIYLPSSPRQLFSDIREPLDVQGYSTLTKVALVILGSLVFLAALGWIKNKVVELKNSEAEKCCRVGLRFFKANQTAAAKKMFFEALNWDPSNKDVMAKVYSGLGLVCDDDKQAKNYFARAMRLNAREGISLSRLYLDRAKSCQDQGLSDLVLQNLERARIFDVPAHQSEILLVLNTIDSGENLDRIQSINLALSSLEQQGRKDDQVADLLRQRAAFYFGQHKDSEALQDINKALECQPSEYLKARLLQNRGVIYARNPETLKLALNAFEAVIQCNFVDSENLDLKKSSLEVIGKIKKRLIELGLPIEVAPSSTSITVNDHPD